MTTMTLTPPRERAAAAPPTSRPAATGEPREPRPGPLHLSIAEVEVMLCFALTSPLNYGPVEEGLCDKLRGHLHSLYAWRPAQTADL